MTTTTIAGRLDGLRQEIPGCRLVALADLSSGLVLVASSAERQSQETLEALTLSASEALNGAAAQGALQLIGPVDEAAVLSSRSVRAFVRSPDDPAEVLCCVGGPEVDVGALILASRRVLAALGGAA